MVKFPERSRIASAMMALLSLLYLAAITAATVAAETSDFTYDVNFDESSYEPHLVMHRDVCIIGGGATGTYAAVRLRDSGQSVVIVEGDNELGGHTRTYHDPDSGKTIDYGVMAYADIEVVHDFFGRFNIPLKETKFDFGDVKWADFRTGAYLPDFDYPTSNLDGYKAQLERYPYIEWTSDLPESVSEELSMPFRDYAKKHSLGDIIPRLYFLMQGPGNIPELPAYYTFGAVSSQLLKNVETHVLVTARGYNQEVYDAALKELGEDVLLSTNVVGAQRFRGGMGVKVLAMTPSGLKIIKAKKLLVTVPPTINNMVPFALDATEWSLFSEFNSQSWYVALVTNTSLPQNSLIQNAAPYLTSTFSTVPSLHIILPTRVPGTYLVKYRSVYPLPEARVKAEIQATVAKLGEPTEDGGQKDAEDIEVLAYHAHVPFDLTVSPEVFKNGFNHKLNSLQGHKNTWYTGAAFLSPHSAALWNYTEGLLPRIMHDL